MEVKYEREKIQVGYMTVSALTVVESRRVFSSEGKKENLTASIYPPPFTLFNKNIFRRSCLSTRKNVGAWDRFVTTPRRFVRPDATPVESSAASAGCQKTPGETQAISGLASRRCVAFHRSSVPSDRSSVERNETCVGKNESFSSIHRSRVASPQSPVKRNEPRVRSYRRGVAKNECSVPRTALAPECVFLFVNLPVLQMDNIGRTGIKT